MIPSGADTVIVRYGGELSTKSRRVRGRMEEQLAANVEALLADRGVGGTVTCRRMRMLVRTTEDEVGAAAEAAASAFGVVSTSPARRVEPSLDAIASVLAEAAEEHYDGGKFAVDARRAGDTHPFTSQDIAEEGGSAIWEAVADRLEPEVDLESPDVTFSVECREDEAFVFLGTRPGPGGFPLGSQSPVVALVSGGIDSPVAAYEAMRRGCPVVPVYVALGDYGGPDHEARAAATVRTLSRYAPNFDFDVHRVPAGEVVYDLAESIDRGRMLVLRRFMLRVAERIAEDVGARGIVTGEAIGQKSSQTLANLAVVDDATALPVHRPLLTRDKDDIVRQAREIGTYEDATIDAGCYRLAPDRVETHGRVEAIRRLEPDDLADRAADVAARAERVSVGAGTDDLAPGEPAPTRSDPRT